MEMNNNTLYLECFSGISGDMTVAALLDLGADVDVLKDGLQSLNVDGYKIKIGIRQKCGIDACDFDVILEHNHSHDHHEHRNIEDIYKIINESTISPRAKAISKDIFHVVGKAEAKAHGVELQEVHFHEVGAIDSIIDIVAVGICIDNLDIEDVIVSELYEGTGHVKCQHGIIPVPVPAVTNIVIDNSLSIKITDAIGEMITPTGAAIVAALKTRDFLPHSYKIKKMGLGAGKKDFDKANILRASIIEEAKNSQVDDVWVLETNIDDSTGEALGFTMDRLLGAGANDVFYTPIYMKKNRPAYKLSLLCHEKDINLMESIIFKNTTSIGIRKYKAERTILDREIISIDTKYGPIECKVVYFENEKYYYPEYDDIKKICNNTGLSFKAVYNEIKMN